jgi:hypothetical protein
MFGMLSPEHLEKYFKYSKLLQNKKDYIKTITK